MGVRRRDIADALIQRQEIRVDPFRQGFGHVESPNSIDLNAVKLCFQVFLGNPKTPGKYTVILDPVISKPILEAKVELTPKFPHNGGFVTEVKNEVLTDGSAWKQMTSQAGPMTVKPRVDPYSKVVLTDGNLGLGGMDYGNPGYEFNIPVTNSPYLIPQSSPDSQGLANLNISDVTSLNVTSTDLANILGQAGC